jgi:hypothetical protein
MAGISGEGRIPAPGCLGRDSFFFDLESEAVEMLYSGSTQQLHVIGVTLKGDSLHWRM